MVKQKLVHLIVVCTYLRSSRQTGSKIRIHHVPAALSCYVQKTIIIILNLASSREALGAATSDSVAILECEGPNTSSLVRDILVDYCTFESCLTCCLGGHHLGGNKSSRIGNRSREEEFQIGSNGLRSNGGDVNDLQCLVKWLPAFVLL